MYNLWTSAILRQYTVVLALNLNCLYFGLGLTWSSPVTVKLMNASQTILERPLDEEEVSWMVSVPLLFSGVGYIVASILVDHIGRKYCVLLSGLVRLLSVLLFLFTFEVWMLLLGRVLGGLSDGILVAVLPVYTSEVSSKEVRGALGSLFQIFSSLGTVIMLSVGPFISFYHLNLMFTIFVVVTSLPTVFVPDSPYFLYSKGRHEECRKFLTFLRGSEEIVKGEIALYAVNKNEQRLHLKYVFSNKLFLKSLLKSSVIVVLIFFTGFNCVMAYLQHILDSTATKISSEVASAVIGMIQMIASLSTMVTTDRFGRKPILVTTTFGMAIGMIGIGTFFKLQDTDTKPSGFLNYLPLISLILVVYCYSAGFGSLLWVVIPELFTDRYRGIGISTALFIGVIPSFLTLRYFTTLVDAIGADATFWTSAAFCFVLGSYVFWSIPETKGKTFAEIQEELENNKR